MTDCIDTTSTVTSSSSERFTGRVKWFNNRAGYGFVTVTDGSSAGTDIFVHHSSIKVDSEQYKYLVQGEYVEFTMLTTPGGEHEYQAGEVSGIKGGKLMCETRRDVRFARTAYRSIKQESSEHATPRVTRSPRNQPKMRGEGPRDSEWGKVPSEWTQVSRKSQPSSPQKRGRGRPSKQSSTNATATTTTTTS
jgi:CspA family cold shock protein